MNYKVEEKSLFWFLWQLHNMGFREQVSARKPVQKQMVVSDTEETRSAKTINI